VCAYLAFCCVGLSDVDSNAIILPKTLPIDVGWIWGSIMVLIYCTNIVTFVI
jgi:hypothetical protein